MRVPHPFGLRLAERVETTYSRSSPRRANSSVARKQVTGGRSPILHEKSLPQCADNFPQLSHNEHRANPARTHTAKLAAKGWRLGIASSPSSLSTPLFKFEHSIAKPNSTTFPAHHNQTRTIFIFNSLNSIQFGASVAPSLGDGYRSPRPQAHQEAPRSPLGRGCGGHSARSGRRSLSAQTSRAYR